MCATLVVATGLYAVDQAGDSVGRQDRTQAAIEGFTGDVSARSAPAGLDLTLPHSRDAWATIRGYVYQVDLSIARWLELAPGEMLLLERGEDIDLVTIGLDSLIDGDDTVIAQRLEQIKHLDANLTLRSPDALEALANAVVHRQANPTSTLRFLFTTNALIVTERPALFPDGTPALRTWERMRQDTGDAGTHKVALDTMRAALSGARRPPGCNPQTWATFLSFVGTTDGHDPVGVDNDGLLGFIRVFEWGAGAPPAKEQRPRVKDMLVALRYADDALDAQALYERLFFHVFTVLTRRGEKRLDVAERDRQLALPTLTARDRARLVGLVSLMRDIEARVTTLERASGERDATVFALNAQIQDLQRRFDLNAQIQDLQRRFDIDGTITLAQIVPDLGIPPLTSHLSARRATIEGLAPRVMGHAWTALHGGVGSGKTQLVSLLMRDLSGPCRWIRMRDLTPEQACDRLDVACAALAGSAIERERCAWYDRLCRQLGRDTCIVLDDLPRLMHGDDLAERLLALARSCHDHGVRLVSLSAHPLPVSVRESLGDDVCVSMPIPVLLDGEVTDVLRSFGAPAALLKEGPASFFNGLARSNPLLLTAIARFLACQGWRWTDTAFDGLLSGAHAIDLNEETTHRLIARVEDDRARDLLYRLSLIQRPFTLDDVRAVAEVAPAVSRPRERLDALVGPWVQRDALDRFVLSPVIDVLGADDLAVATRRGCHAVLGDRLSRQRTLTEHEAVAAITHFVRADEHDRAGLFLASLLHRLHTEDDGFPADFLLAVWAELPLPREMSLGIRLLVRGVQIAVRHQRDLPTDYLTRDADVLLRDATSEDAWAVVALAVYAPTHSNRYLGRALAHYSASHLQTAQLADRRPFLLPDSLTLESLVWLHIDAVTSPARLAEWLDVIEGFDGAQRVRAFAGHLAEMACLGMSNRVWLEETAKPDDERNLPALDNALQALANRARGLGGELLWACLVRARIVVHAEYLGDLAGATRIADAALGHASTDRRVRFLLAGEIGEQIEMAGRHDNAWPYLEQAVAQQATEYAYLDMILLLVASKARGAHDIADAVGYAQQAVDVARASTEIPRLQRVRALGELAIARYMAGDLGAAFAACDEVGTDLLAERDDSGHWKDLLLRCIALTAYLATVAQTGAPPDLAPHGLPGVTLKRGFFLPTTRVPMQYEPAYDGLIPLNLTAYAQAIGNQERAAAWIGYAVDLAREGAHMLGVGRLAVEGIPDQVIGERYDDALTTALHVGSLLVVAEDGNAGLTQGTGLHVHDVLGPRPNGRWDRAENYAALLGLLPVFFGLCAVTIHEPERARLLSTGVAAWCRDLARAATRPRMWEVAADLLADIFGGTASWEELSRRIDPSQHDQDPIARVLACIGTSVQHICPPPDAVTLQLEVWPYIHRKLSLTPAYGRVVLPFLTTYWNIHLAQTKGLTRVRGSSDERRAQEILGTVAVALHVEPTAEGAAWIRGE